MTRYLLLLTLTVGCVKAPDVVIVDRKTALEQQASGSFRGLEEDLTQAGLSPRPAPVTGAQLEAAGVLSDPAAETATGLANPLLVDALLTQRCIGEGNDGALVVTVDRCTGTIDVPQTTRLIERVNRNRRQLWQWLGARDPKKPAADVQASWRTVHLAGVICGGQVQKSDGTWEVKRC